ncbi:MAG: DUF1684 domain-containing protein [Actinomycetota bacterium]|nr:DUF1684 domain-containing protein [Actinomycetota bacterium]
MNTAEALELLDWKRRVFALYAEVREELDPERAWQRWRQERDELFRNHPQSALTEEARAAFSGLSYFPYDPGLRLRARLNPASAETYSIPTSGDETIEFQRLATVEFEVRDRACSLEAYWLTGYGGGLFLPFRDATSGSTTYGAGRYLLDTVKGADLGTDDGAIVLDFNFAYNPSCSYNPRWVCPLAPPANRLDIPVEAGERT